MAEKFVWDQPGWDDEDKPDEGEAVRIGGLFIAKAGSDWDGMYVRLKKDIPSLRNIKGQINFGSLSKSQLVEIEAALKAY